MQCIPCAGSGNVECTKCSGQGKLKIYLSLTAKFRNHHSDEVIAKGQLPPEVKIGVAHAQGKTVYQTTAVLGVPFASVDAFLNSQDCPDSSAKHSYNMTKSHNQHIM